MTDQPVTTQKSAPRLTLGKLSRIKHDDEFEHVLKAGIKKSRGPLTFRVAPSKTKHSRIGIRIGRVVGTAPVRNRIKRLLRESFRLMQHDWTSPIDVIVLVRKHEPMKLVEYQEILSKQLQSAIRDINKAETNVTTGKACP